MAITNADLKIKSAKLLQALRGQYVYGNLFNTEFEGEIKGLGSQLQINNVTGGTVKTYTKGQKLDAPETLTDGKIDFVINEADYFNIGLDAMDEAFGARNYFNPAMMETVSNMVEKAENFYASKYTEIPAENMIGSDIAPYSIDTPSKAYDLIIDLGEILDNNNVPTMGRWIVVPNWFYNMLKKDDRVNKDTAKGDEIVRTGEIVEVDGMRVYKSNFTPNESKGVKEKIMAGYAGSATRADAIDDTEEYSHPDYFGKFAKGLHVYGAKIARPSSMALAIVSKA